jgi:hypothetical protein
MAACAALIGLIAIGGFLLESFQAKDGTSAGKCQADP